MSVAAGDDLELVATAVVAGGAGLAREPAGMVVLVEGALPGERVRARVTGRGRDFARAVTLDVLDPSPDRVAPPCPALAAGCGGCTWQHVEPSAQARLKAAIVVDALRRIARLPDPPQPAMAPSAGAPALRTSARLTVGADGRAGHRPRREAATPVATHTCRAVHPLLEELIVDGRYPPGAEVVLRVGVASGERLVRVPGRRAGVQVPDGVVVTTGRGRPAAVHEEVAGRRFRVSADSFFQPGPVAAAALAGAVDRAVGDVLGPGGVLIDAYAGVGLFASVLGARRGARVVAVESQAAAAADARSNLADLDARVVATAVGRWPGWPTAGADVVVADPARSGLGRPGAGALAASGAARLVLASCDPASLARDAALLAGAGYRLAEVALVDAFPDTFHVETVARFEGADRARGA